MQITSIEGFSDDAGHQRQGRCGGAVVSWWVWVPHGCENHLQRLEISSFLLNIRGVGFGGQEICFRKAPIITMLK